MEKTLKMLYNIKPMGDYIMNSDLNRIKKKYGENFAHLCRELFPTILETEGLLPDIIENKFYPNKFLYDDIINSGLKSEFQRFINNLLLKEGLEEIEEINTNKTPYELLNEAGYILYECKTNEDIQEFKKYYKEEEMLCTFKDNSRLKTNYVFFAVKKNVDDIIRENFKNPERQDEYGTSVISIQFTKGRKNYLSIKNRYNHSVINPDVTFHNDLDNIIPGLTKSFENFYNFGICNSTNQKFELTDYVLVKDGKYYKYNYEINNIYYCTDNIIIDNFQAKKYEKERYIIFDYFILDLKEKTINLYDANIEESFCKYHKNIEKIEIKKEKDKKYILLKKDDHQIIIVLDNENKMISYYNDLVTNINDSFLYNNIYLKSIYIDNVVTIADWFMYNNIKLKNIQMPSLTIVGNEFISGFNKLEEISFPKLEYIGNRFLSRNVTINSVDLPRVKVIGYSFMEAANMNLKYLELPRVVRIGQNFLTVAQMLSYFSAPYLEEVGHGFLFENKCLKTLELPSLKRFGEFFLATNEVLEELRLPSLEAMNKNCLMKNEKVKILELSKNACIPLKKTLVISKNKQKN